MGSPCAICGGERQVRLPVRPSAVSTVPLTFETMPTTVSQPWKVFPCPECAPLVAKEQVCVLEHHAQADIRYEHDRGYREALVQEAIHGIAALIEKNGHMQIQEIPGASGGMLNHYRVTVGVVSPNVVKDIEAEQFNISNNFCQQVIEEANYQFSNWGSSYGYSSIHKETAKQLLADAFRTVMKRRPINPTNVR